MKLSIDFGPWTTTKAALAAAGVLAIGAVGSAVAFSPTIVPPIKWQGGAEFVQGAAVAGLNKVYTVPSGRNFLLTDLMIANIGTETVAVMVFSGQGGNCTTGLVQRTTTTYVWTQSTYALSFQTGIGFAAGQAVCLSASNTDVDFSGRGFLFTPS